MEKEFEALDNLEKVIEEITINNADLRNTLKTSVLITTIKQALTELKEIKEAKPSEAMEILLKAKQERLNFYGILLDNDEIFFEKLEQALLKAQELEKVLEIIFKKGLPLSEIKMIKQSDNYEQYVIGFSWANFKNISIQKTQKEFALLKRWSEKLKEVLE